MKNIKYLFVSVLISVFVSCQEKEYGPSSFGMAEDTYGTVLFSYGAQKQFNMTVENIKVHYIKPIKGWSGKINRNILTITAPTKDCEYETVGKIGLYARGYDDVEYILWVEVEVSDDAKEGQSASYTAIFEQSELRDGLWTGQDTFRVYDENDADGFEFRLQTGVPEGGAAEVLYDGIISDNAENIYAAYPADASLRCTSDGKFSTLSLSGSQTGVVGGYDKALDVSFASADDGKLLFKTPYAWLKITLDDGLIRKVTISEQDGSSSLAGKYVYNVHDMRIEEISEAVSALTLVPSSEDTRFALGTYYVAVFPQELSGIKIIYEISDEDVREVTVGGTLKLDRNSILDLGVIKGSTGDGSENDPYQLRSVSDLQGMTGLLTAGTEVHFKLMNDMNLSDVNWIPISDGKAQIHFDGNYKTISNLSCSTGKASFFGVLNGSCRNLSLRDAVITGDNDIAGILAGQANANISGVYVSGTVTSKVRRTGGMVGYLTGGSLSGCQAKVNVSNTSGVSVGGLVGGQETGFVTISDCHLLETSVIVGAGEYVGGIVGYFTEGELIGCTVTNSSVKGNSGYTGGVVGYCKTDVVGCKANSVTVECGNSKDYAGGIVGNSAGAATISKCAVENSTISARRMSGGIVGYVAANTKVENSYSHNCTIYATHRRAGGIIGEVKKDTHLAVSNCYSTATCKAQYTVAGIASFEDSATTAQSSYSGCVAWNGKLEQTEAASTVPTYYSGAIVGNASRNSIFQNCYRKSGLTLTVPYSDTGYQPVDQENCDGENTLLTNGTYADNKYGWQYLYPYHGKSTELTTVSAVAKSLSWDETVWNLSGDYPKLK